MTRAVVTAAVLVLFMSACGEEPVRKGWPSYVPGTGQRTAAGEPKDFGFGDTLGPDDVVDDSPAEDRRFDRLGSAPEAAGNSAPASLAPLLADGGVDVSAIGCVMEPGAMNPPADRPCEVREYRNGLETVTTYDDQGRQTSWKDIVLGTVLDSQTSSWSALGEVERETTSPYPEHLFQHERWEWNPDGSLSWLTKKGARGALEIKRRDAGRFEASFTPFDPNLQFSAFASGTGTFSASFSDERQPSSGMRWRYDFDSRGHLVRESWEVPYAQLGPFGHEVAYSNGLVLARHEWNYRNGADWTEEYQWSGGQLVRITGRNDFPGAQRVRTREWIVDATGLLRGRRLVEDGAQTPQHVEIWQENIYACGTTKLLFSRVRAVGVTDPNGRVDVRRDSNGRIVEELLAGAARDLNGGIERRTYRYECSP